jgi:hypothetical protein
MRYVLTALLVLMVLAPRPAVAQAIRQLSTWESQMVTYGKKQGDALAAWLATADIAAILADKTTQSVGAGLEHTYYDRQRVMLQIAAYRNERTPWVGYANDAAKVYRDLYVGKYCPDSGYKTGVNPPLPVSMASIPGYWNFTTGLRMDFEKNGTLASKTAVHALSLCASYGNPRYEKITGAASREVAYNIIGKIDAQALTGVQDPYRKPLVDIAYGHLDETTVQQVWKSTTDQVSPFMVALTAQALIRDWEQTKDARLLPALQKAADWMWLAWIPTAGAMRYDVNPNSSTYTAPPAPDLNLIIAPVYGFLYAQTANTVARDRGDLLFAGGVTQAWLDGPKQFNQNYWWSFDFVKWRQGTATPSRRPASRVAPASPTVAMWGW